MTTMYKHSQPCTCIIEGLSALEMHLCLIVLSRKDIFFKDNFLQKTKPMQQPSDESHQWTATTGVAWQHRSNEKRGHHRATLPCPLTVLWNRQCSRRPQVETPSGKKTHCTD